MVRLTRNCPWNRCRFCTSYKKGSFEVRPVEDIRRDIDSMAAVAELLLTTSEKQGHPGRIDGRTIAGAVQAGVPVESSYQIALFLQGGRRHAFLQDGDSLSMNPDAFVSVLLHLRSRFPTIERITTYARSSTLARRGPGVLTQAREAGLTRVHVGMESGSDEVLKIIRKGATVGVHIMGGRAALEAGLELSEYVMPGVGGVEHSLEHAIETGRVLDEINPHFIRLRTFYPLAGSEIERDFSDGSLTQCSEDETVREIRLMVESITTATSTLFSDHNRNLLMELEGKFPEEKEIMLWILDRYLNLPDHDRLIFRIGRRIGIFSGLDDIGDASAYAHAEDIASRLQARFGDADIGLKKAVDVRM